jgi:hypothetical protein
MCRASVEALLYVSKTSEGRYSVLKPDASWGELESWAREKGLLKGLKKKVDRVHESGSFSAHLAERIDAEYLKWYLKESAKAKTHSRRSAPRRLRGILLRPDKETARKRLLETSEIIITVTKRRWP